MAPRARSAGGKAAPEVVDQVLALPVAQIEVGDRLRPVDPIHAEALAALIARDGQDAPIEVCQLPGKSGWLLVTGGHRLAAVRLAGRETIKAVVVTPDKAERRRKEVSENLFRRGLDPIDRAAFVAELYSLEKVRAGLEPAADPRTAGANARWAKEVKNQAADATVTMTVAYGFSDRAAAQLGFSVETLRRDLALHRGLPAHLIARLRGLPIASNAGQLRALAKMNADDQLAVVGMIERSEAKGPSDAIARLHQRAKPNQDNKAWWAVISNFDRMSAADKRLVLTQLARSPSLPPDLKALLSPLLREEGTGNGEVDRLQPSPVGGVVVRDRPATDLATAPGLVAGRGGDREGDVERARRGRARFTPVGTGDCSQVAEPPDEVAAPGAGEDGPIPIPAFVKRRAADA